MEIKIISEKGNRMEVELTSEDHTFANLLREVLWTDKDVDVSAYRMEHPLTGKPKVLVITKSGKPRDALVKAAKKSQKMGKQIQEKASKAL